MAVGNAVLDVVLAPGFLDEVKRKGLLFKQRLAAVADAYPRLVAEVRGEGLMLGIRCVAPAAEIATAFRTERLLTVGAGENVLRFLPPLTVTDAEIGEGVARVERALAALAEAAPHGAAAE
jgi:acetylornithine/N-succinyldiaminopimelate aminotransferase